MTAGNALAGRRVLITGHTGFKGGWLALWLQGIGAEVHGLALAPDTDPSLFAATGLGGLLTADLRCDIRDAAALAAALRQTDPEVIFHLAAQPLVRRSHDAPLDTFATNTMGTANLLDACRALPRLRAVICVTTDKVYDNREWQWPYRESDALGGGDAYAASKAAAELVTGAYARAHLGPRGISVHTARGGNVIGGGDWSEDRLVPDLARAWAGGGPLRLRNPQSVRPWQHVLCLCHGYLALADRALAGDIGAQGAWNFGPDTGGHLSVAGLLKLFAAVAPVPPVDAAEPDGKPESTLLALDSSRARALLGWQPALDIGDAARLTAEWYRAARAGGDMLAITRAQIADYRAALARGQT